MKNNCRAKQNSYGYCGETEVIHKDLDKMREETEEGSKFIKTPIYVRCKGCDSEHKKWAVIDKEEHFNRFMETPEIKEPKPPFPKSLMGINTLS